VCSGRAVTIRRLLDLLIARARCPVTVKIDPARYRPNDNPILLGDPSRLRDELGWTPEIPVERTVDDLLEYWRGKTS
jgi:GDP-4-dehydro-6-deoxy-D-mannose reductase